jgi:small conductance mechanosensitive channel
VPNLTRLDLDSLLAEYGGRLLAVVVIVVAAALVYRLGRVVIHRAVEHALDRPAADSTAAELSAMERRKRVETLDGFFVKLLRGVVVVAATILVLNALGLLAALAGLSLIGAGLAFAAQNTIRDFLNGAFILLENQYAKGDVVRIAGVAGSVEDFSLRRTTLRDLDGTVHVVPNGAITVASNLTRTWARINENVPIAYESDLARAIEVIDAVGAEMAASETWRRRILEPPRVLRVDQLGDSAVVLKVLGTVRAADQWEAAGELRRRLLDAFREQGIEIPYPRRVVIARAEGHPRADEPARAEEQAAAEEEPRAEE